jgi:hypothetical protein
MRRRCGRGDDESGQGPSDEGKRDLPRHAVRQGDGSRCEVELVWGINAPHDLEKQVPRLHLVENVAFLTMPDLVGWLSKSWLSGAMYGVMGRLPFYRNLIRHVRYEFSGQPGVKTAP